MLRSRLIIAGIAAFAIGAVITLAEHPKGKRARARPAEAIRELDRSRRPKAAGESRPRARGDVPSVDFLPPSTREAPSTGRSVRFQAQNGTPIPRVLVVAESRPVALSDSEGLAVLPLDTDRGVCLHDGYLPRQLASSDVSAAGDPAVVTMVPGMAVSGQVVDQDDRPVAGSVVTLCCGGGDATAGSGQPTATGWELSSIGVSSSGRWVYRRTAVTDAEGRYRFAGLPVGSGILWAEKHGYVADSAVVPVEVDAADHQCPTPLRLARLFVAALVLQLPVPAPPYAETCVRLAFAPPRRTRDMSANAVSAWLAVKEQLAALLPNETVRFNVVKAAPHSSIGDVSIELPVGVFVWNVRQEAGTKAAYVPVDRLVQADCARVRIATAKLPEGGVIRVACPVPLCAMTISGGSMPQIFQSHATGLTQTFTVPVGQYVLSPSQHSLAEPMRRGINVTPGGTTVVDIDAALLPRQLLISVRDELGRPTTAYELLVDGPRHTTLRLSGPECGAQVELWCSLGAHRVELRDRAGRIGATVTVDVAQGGVERVDLGLR